MTTAEGWSYRVNIADIMLDSDDDTPERGRRIAERLKMSTWVQSMPDHEPIHQYIREMESGDPTTVITAAHAMFDEAAYHRVHVETVLVIPNPEAL